MATMKFAMIEPTLHDDPNWRALAKNRNARLAYLVIRTGTRTDYPGFFCCRLDAFASECMFSEEELPDLISVLEQHRFIEYDHGVGLDPNCWLVLRPQRS